jgi:hypothetical protein
MREVIVDIGPLPRDPDLDLGGILTLERADGRSVWRQRLVVVAKADGVYTMKATMI